MVRKSQILSTDVIIVIIVVLIGLVTFLIYEIDSTKEKELKVTFDEELETSSQKIWEDLLSKGIIVDQNVDVSKMNEINIDQIKQDLSITDDFIIYFEKDEKLVDINPNPGSTCYGDFIAEVNGVYCE